MIHAIISFITVLPLSFAEVTNWLDLFGLQLGHLIGSDMFQRPSPADLVRAPSTLSGSQKLSVGLKNRLDRALASLQQPNLVAKVSSLTLSDLSPPGLKGKIHSSPSPFGRGLLLSDMKQKAIVNGVPGSENEVVSNVLSSVINASTVLDICYSGLDEFYFLKRDERAFGDDYQQLQRLSGSHNISAQTLSPAGRQLCAVSRDHVVVCVVYGVDMRSAIRHVVRDKHKLAVDQAWQREVRAAKNGQLGHWTASQSQELIQRGHVSGFTPVEVRNVHKYPQLIGQSSNIMFVTDTEAQNWHSLERRTRNNS